MDVEELRARCIREVGRKHLPLRHAVDQPAVNRAHAELARLHQFVHAIYILQDPRELRCREIWGKRQARDIRDILSESPPPDGLADGRPARALPDDGRIDGLARLPVPCHGRFALVADADGADFPPIQLHGLNGFLHEGFDILPDFLWVMLDPAAFIDVLGMHFGILIADFPCFIEEQQFCPLRALVDANDVRLHIKASPVPSSRSLLRQGRSDGRSRPSCPSRPEHPAASGCGPSSGVLPP